MNILIVLNTLIFLTLAIIWNKKDLINLSITIILTVVGLGNLLLLLKISGYIIKI